VRDESGAGSPSSSARDVELPGDIILSIVPTSALTLRDAARMAGTCKLFRKALLMKLDSEVQWLTDLTYNALGENTVEIIITWLTAKPSKRVELFGPHKLQRLNMRNKSASELATRASLTRLKGSSSRCNGRTSTSDPLDLTALKNAQHLEALFGKTQRHVPTLILGETGRARSVPSWFIPLGEGAYGARVWYEVGKMPSYITVPYIGLLLLMWKRVAESGSERELWRLWCAPGMASNGKWLFKVKESLLPENWGRARDAFHMSMWRRELEFWLQPWGKISRSKRLRRRR
jgi:hypothetical protein